MYGGQGGSMSRAYERFTQLLNNQKWYRGTRRTE